MKRAYSSDKIKLRKNVMKMFEIIFKSRFFLGEKSLKKYPKMKLLSFSPTLTLLQTIST